MMTDFLATPLHEYIEELGYPRNEFIGSLSNNNKNIPAMNESIEDGYYIITYNYNDESGYTLIKSKKNIYDSVAKTVPIHLYSSIIKNILLGSYEKELTYNMLLFILYYKVTYRSSVGLSIEQITEGVIIELSNIIKLLIDKEDSTYKNERRISNIIDEIRTLLKRERIHVGIRPKLNLRR